jgi:hypothetical protein
MAILGRYITKDGYIKILQKFVHKCPGVKYCFLTKHGLKRILKYKMQLKIFVFNSCVLQMLYVVCHNPSKGVWMLLVWQTTLLHFVMWRKCLISYSSSAL